MKLTEKLKHIQDKHMGEYLKERSIVLDELSAKQSMFCICRRLATGLHEMNCRQFHNKVTSETVKRLKHLCPKK